MSDNFKANNVHEWLHSKTSQTPSSDCYDTDSMPSIDFGCDDNSREDKLARKWLNALDIIKVLEYLSDLMYIVSDLGGYITPKDSNDTEFNKRLDELLDLLYNVPNSSEIEHIPEFKNIMLKVVNLKDTLIKVRGFK